MDMAIEKYKSIYDWKKRAIKRYEFYVNKEKNKEMFDYLESIPNKQSYLLGLIEKDMGKKPHINVELEKKYGKEI